jgi:hypothetical protein
LQDIDAHTYGVPEPLGELNDDAIERLTRQPEIALRRVPLLVRLLPLGDGLSGDTTNCPPDAMRN